MASGFKAARYSLIFYTDGDGQYDLSELPLLFDCLTKDVDVVNGIKLERQDTTARIVIGNAYKSVMRNLFNTPVYDVDCDFRLIRGRFLKGIEINYHSGAVCVELVKKLQKNGARFREVSVHHLSRKHGSSQFFKFWPLFYTAVDLLKLFKELYLTDERTINKKLQSKINVMFRRIRNTFRNRTRVSLDDNFVTRQKTYYNNSDNYFNKLARHTEITFKSWIGFLSSNLSTNSSKKILEIGCGIGLSTKMIAEKFPRAKVFGTDLSQRFVKFAQKTYKAANLEYKVMSATKITFPAKSLDAICLFDVIEHINDVELFLNEANRTLKRGGKLIISSPNPLNLWVPYRDLRRWRTRPPYTEHPIQNIPLLVNNLITIVKKFFSQQVNFLYMSPNFSEKEALLSDTDLTYLANPIDLSKSLRKLGFDIESRSAVNEVHPILRPLEAIFYPFYSIRIVAKKLR